VRLYSRPGNDLTYRFPLIVEALAKLRSRKNPSAPAVRR
jgi:ATP-dependent DNA ligase